MPAERSDAARGDIRDVRLALEGAFETAAPQTAQPPAVAAPRSVVARALPWAGAAALFVALSVALWALWRVEKPVDRSLVRLDVDLGADSAFPSANSISGQPRDLARRHAARLGLRHPTTTVHPPPGSAEAQRTSGNAESNLSVLLPRRSTARCHHTPDLRRTQWGLGV